MKKILLACLILLSSKIFSQNVWSPAGQMFGTADNVRSIAATINGDLYASSWARGIYKSTNLGVTWSLSGLAGKRVSVIVDAPNGNIYALSMTVDSSYIHRSTNEGNTWTNIFVKSFPLNYAGGGAIVFPYDGSILAAFSVTVGPTIGDVSGFVYKSTDNGSSWFRTVQIGGGFVGGMVITSDNKILIGTSLSGVFYSINNGNSFAHLSTFPPVFIRTIIKAEDNAVYVSDAFGLSRSTDNGASWINVGSQQSTSYLRAAISAPDGTLYISMDDRKVFYSTNRGDKWIQMNEGLPSAAYVYCFGYSSGKLFAGTTNAGVYVYDSPTSVGDPVANVNDYRLEQNYPNPFNPNTIINFEVPSNVKNQISKIKFAVYDISGKEVSVLVNEIKGPGKYEVRFDGSNFSSGIYFYKLEADGETIDVKQMMLVK